MITLDSVNVDPAADPAGAWRGGVSRQEAGSREAGRLGIREANETAAALEKH